jgi:hypothetical protein
MEQESLPGYGRYTIPLKGSKKAKKKAAAAKKGEPKPYKGPSFLGEHRPQPLNHDGSNVSCPCGRVYLLPYARGGLVVFDSQAPLGQASLGAVPVATAKRVLAEKGCRLHVNADVRRAPVRIADWKRERDGDG